MTPPLKPCDIVDRLSGTTISDAFNDGRITSGVFAEQLITDRHDARDEILRLRAEIESLRRPSAWRPIGEAPRDGTPIQARIPGHGSDNIIAWQDGLRDSQDRECGGWVFVSDQEPPDDWTDGVCWAVNADGVPSTAPTEWKPLPTPPEGEDGREKNSSAAGAAPFDHNKQE